jgi:hypothetical protein
VDTPELRAGLEEGVIVLAIDGRSAVFFRVIDLPIRDLR